MCIGVSVGNAILNFDEILLRVYMEYDITLRNKIIIYENLIEKLGEYNEA